MNVVNRIGVSLVLLAVAAIALMLALSPAPLTGPLEFALGFARRTLDPVTQLWVAVIALVVAVASLLLLIAEWRRPSKRAVVVTKVPGGTAELAIESVASRIKRAAESVTGVREASPVIRPRRNGIDVLLRLAADPDIDLPGKSREVMEVVRTEASQGMGISVKSLRVTFRQATPGSRLPAPPPEYPTSSPPDV